jgi:acyl carrier protein
MSADHPTHLGDDDLRRHVLSALADVAPEADLSTLPGDTDIRVALEVDSFDLQSIMEGIAVRTGVEVPEGDYARVVTVDGCVAYLQARLTTA